jgi:pyrimidine deaminase RibD-like protein
VRALSDSAFMRRALALAAPGVGRTGANPSVGCVIVKDGIVVGEGATADGGRPHAEELALSQAGDAARGATAYVTLEPCAKRSTGAASCSDILAQAGVARVVIAVGDPHPFAAGVGVERLRAAGVVVEIGLMADEARALNAAFFAKWDKI